MSPSFQLRRSLAVATLLAFSCNAALAASISRIAPASELFSSGTTSGPVIARFLPGQRFDLQATIQPDPGMTITYFDFLIDGTSTLNAVTIPGSGTYDPRPLLTSMVTETGAPATCIDATTGKTRGASGCTLVAGLAGNTAVVSRRAYSDARAGVHSIKVVAIQSDGKRIEATGNFEIVGVQNNGQLAKNIVIFLGDGMGATHRTAGRMMAKGYAQGKARGMLSMDTFPQTGMVMTASLNSIVTDSAPGMQNYVTGNKSNNNEEGVYPDDTRDAFDNPRVEYLSSYLHTLQGKSLGVVTTSDVFDATPASMAVHTSSRGNGTGIVDQFFDDRGRTGLTVLLGGGRKWFLPNTSNSTNPQAANGSQRRTSNDYVLADDIVNGWGSARGALDPGRDLIAEFVADGFKYAPDRSAMMQAFQGGTPDKLLGLFSYSNMNVAYDKINARRGNSEVVDAFGFPDQPMLDEMTDAALKVLSKNPNGFVVMIEAASIDKQAHNMDSDRWPLEVLELDRSVAVAKRFAQQNPDTLVLVTADHECGGVAIIGSSLLTAAALGANPATGNATVGVYEQAKFPRYIIAADGYPMTANIDNKMLIGYGANADRYETWLPSIYPVADSQQPFAVAGTPASASVRNENTGVLIGGQVPGTSAVHTGGDIPLSAFGRGAGLFGGTYDNTDVFFKIGQAAIGGAQ